MAVRAIVLSGATLIPRLPGQMIAKDILQIVACIWPRQNAPPVTFTIEQQQRDMAHPMLVGEPCHAAAVRW